MRKTYKFRLRPTKNQVVELNSWLTLCRRLYNACLEQRRIAYREYGILLSMQEQKRQLPKLKKVVLEYNKIHSQVLQDVVKRTDKSFQGFFRRIKQRKKPGYPRFKSRYRYNSFTFPQYVFSVKSNKLKLGKLGNLKVVLHREIPPEMQVKTLTIKRDNCGDWWAIFSTNDKKEIPQKQTINTVVGIDVGINKLATLSNGQYFENKKHIKQQEKKLKRLNRRLSKKKKGSKNRNKARLKRAKAYRKLTNQRNDYRHKISRYLVSNFDFIAFEKLTIKKMITGNRLAKSINDSAWDKLIQYTAYKAEEAGKTVVLVDPKNTSQRCSSCGVMVKKSLFVRTHSCPNCNFESDRDLNASLNILNRALKEIGRESSEFTLVEIGVQQLENITSLLSRSMKQEITTQVV